MYDILRWYRWFRQIEWWVIRHHSGCSAVHTTCCWGVQPLQSHHTHLHCHSHWCFNSSRFSEPWWGSYRSRYGDIPGKSTKYQKHSQIFRKKFRKFRGNPPKFSVNFLWWYQWPHLTCFSSSSSLGQRKLAKLIYLDDWEKHSGWEGLAPLQHLYFHLLFVIMNPQHPNPVDQLHLRSPLFNRYQYLTRAQFLREEDFPVGGFYLDQFEG